MSNDSFHIVIWKESFDIFSKQLKDIQKNKYCALDNLFPKYPAIYFQKMGNNLFIISLLQNGAHHFEKQSEYSVNTYHWQGC